jgi:hypothetical protein
MYIYRSFSYTCDHVLFASNCLVRCYAAGIAVGTNGNTRKMNKESIWILLARKMTGEATEEELKELGDLLKNDPTMNYIAETFSGLWNRQAEEKRIDSSFS